MDQTRRRRQAALAILTMVSYSGCPIGLKAALYLERRLSYRSWDSIARTTLAERRPCFRAFMLERALPSSVTGPREFFPFSLDAFACASERVWSDISYYLLTGG